MRKLRVLLALGLLLLTVDASYAQAPSSVAWQTANAAYQHGHWEAAAEGYRALVDQGINDASLWYNLGNAYALSGDIGRARFSYDRALDLSPRNGDVQTNRALLLQRLVDRESEEPAVLHFARGYTKNELAATTSLLWFAGCVLLATWLRRRKEATAWLAAVCLGLMLCSGGLFALRACSDAAGRQAVVIPSEIHLLAGPGRDYASRLTLHAGTQLQVRRADGDWREVDAPGRVSGWVRSEQLWIDPVSLSGDRGGAASVMN